MTDDTPQKRDLKEAPSSRELATNRTDDPKYYPPYQSADYGKIMAQSKKKRQSKTFWGIWATVLGALATLFGVSVEFGWLADGIQPRDIAIAVSTVGTILAWAWKNWGQRTATKPIRGYE